MIGILYSLLLVYIEYRTRRVLGLPLRRNTEVPLHPREPEDATERAKLKNIICKNILTSYFFQMQGVMWSDSDREDVQDYLRINQQKYLSFYVQ